jgi:ectoine hydroxylase-related dioxygenase (phytanoyl-CoA dioxygenase family)
MGMEHGYAEVVHRAHGRYDMLDEVNGSPALLTAAQLWLPVIGDALGQDSNRLFNGLLMTKPGSDEQLWHVDGEHLFTATHPRKDHSDDACNPAPPTLPVHCINVFVPLVDITATNGATEFCTGSHTLTDISPELVWQVPPFLPPSLCVWAPSGQMAARI